MSYSIDSIEFEILADAIAYQASVIDYIFDCEDADFGQIRDSSGEIVG